MIARPSSALALGSAAIAGLIVGYILGGIIWEHSADAALERLVHWLRDYQALIAGLMAIGAAGVTLHHVRAQISQTDRLAAADLNRQIYAARAMLPMALTELSEYAGICATVLHKSIPVLPGQPEVQVPISGLPTLPSGMLDTFYRAIRFADKSDAQVTLPPSFIQPRVESGRFLPRVRQG